MNQREAPRFPYRLFDLTHPIAPGGPVWPGDPPTKRFEATSHDEEGFALQGWTLSEHAGTHVGSPSHYIPKGVTIDRMPLEELVLPAVVLDVRGQLMLEGQVTVDHVRSFEVGWGELLPAGAAVLLLTGWDERWPDWTRVYEKDRRGVYLWPGFTGETAEWLIVERGVRALGTDAPGIDPGSDSMFAAGHACARARLPHLENLANLDLLPDMGAWLMIGALPLEGGHGSPARVMGLVK